MQRIYVGHRASLRGAMRIDHSSRSKDRLPDDKRAS
jgi:hypothetical protein